ncbi:hypothetical protein KJS94_14330 [Flavihumibacter rivuli]|uniref:hypothetical protein n=1 Tax=Flavihumibacter rivuli TaxID=2838156 RepID=UPI001BDEFB47|nr:hypothetical protein [Flavihumibacter rivuli]ULQ55823.1 hypothetical protein KJS94_14330 [Flavihumibacter rivuli]
MKKMSMLFSCLYLAGSVVSAQEPSTHKKDMDTHHHHHHHHEMDSMMMGHKEMARLKGNEVSYLARENFKKDFGEVNGVNWERTDYLDKATFVRDGKQEAAYYDIDGSLVGTVVKKEYSALPANAQKMIEKRFAGYSKGDVILFNDNEINETDMVLYGEQFDDQDNYFIELFQPGKRVILKVDKSGNVYTFKTMNN